jgi:hypothetical protein
MGIFKKMDDAKSALEKEKLKNVELQYEKTKKLNEDLERELKKLRSEILTEDLILTKPVEEEDLSDKESEEIFNTGNKNK